MGKINIKADSHFFDIVKSMLEDRFDIPCVDSMGDFRKFKKALTINGQFKTNHSRHEKDDSFRLSDRRRWSLGWENASKLKVMQEEDERLSQKILFINNSIKALHVEEAKLKNNRDNLRDILKFGSFSEIDWYMHLKKIENLNSDFEELQKSSNILKSLQKQLNVTDERLSQLSPKKEKLERFTGKLESDIELRSSELGVVKEYLEGKIDEDIESKLEALFSKEGLNLVNISLKERELRVSIQSSLGKIVEKIKNSSEKLLTLMHSYKNIYRVESKELDASVGSIDDFGAKLEELKKDDLPKFEKRFRSLFKEKTIQKTVMVQEELEYQANKIKEKIMKINNSLRDIEYNSGTFIKLVAELSINKEIRDFKQDLKSATSFAFNENSCLAPKSYSQDLA